MYVVLCGLYKKHTTDIQQHMYGHLFDIPRILKNG